MEEVDNDGRSPGRPASASLRAIPMTIRLTSTAALRRVPPLARGESHTAVVSAQRTAAAIFASRTATALFVSIRVALAGIAGTCRPDAHADAEGNHARCRCTSLAARVLGEVGEDGLDSSAAHNNYAPAAAALCKRVRVKVSVRVRVPSLRDSPARRRGSPRLPV